MTRIVDSENIKKKVFNLYDSDSGKEVLIMEQDNKNKDGNTGCAIAIGIFVLANIICYFATSSKQEVAGNGAFFMSIIFVAAAYLGIKAYLQYTEEFENKFVRICVPIGIFIVLMLVLGTIINDFSTMVAIDSTGFITFCIILGILIYNSHKD